MTLYPGQKWKVEPPLAEEVRNLLLHQGGVQDEKITNPHELWRVRFSDSTFTYYKTGTLYCTDTRDPAVVQMWQEISARGTSGFVQPTREFLIGLDETGKGEVLGHTVLAGVILSRNVFDHVGKVVGVADTKKRHTFAYWDNILRQLDSVRPPDLQFITETVPPWHIDKFNINQILDIIYQRILSNFARMVTVASCRIVLDDYGAGESLRRYLRALKNTGAGVVIAHQADDTHLEAKVASLIAKREREKSMETISKSEIFKVNGLDIGTDNAGDAKTVAWLKAWKATGKEWPWFVKRSFRTIRHLDGLPEADKLRPPIREDILSEEFKKEFQQGRFSVTSLSVVCPSCGERSKAVLITHQNNSTDGRCPGCKKAIPGLSITLRYYCGFVLPDSNIIIGGLLSKDLEHTKFFEGFTVLLDPIVKMECETEGGRKEFERLARYAAMGRIKLKDVENDPHVETKDSLARDERIKEDALRFDAILVTGDNTMKAFAQAKNLFCLYA